MDPLFDDLVAEAHSRPIPQPTPRRVTMPWLTGKVDAVVGMRRSGKTWFLFQRFQELLATGVPREALLYVNFEDERLGTLTTGDLARVVEAHHRRTSGVHVRHSAFFFDEIQLVPGWERFLRRVVDSGEAHVCVTGSSAKLLSREIATSLRGRALATEIFPFGFQEALDHHARLRGSPAPKGTPNPRIRAAVEARFADYLVRGGFPEVQALDEALRVRVLQDYLDVAILRDLIERHAISNAIALRRFVRQLMNSPASLVSLHKIHADLKSQGLHVAKDSVHAWFDHLEDAFVFFGVPIHTASERVRQSNPRKTYAIDPGMVTACARRGSADTGHLLETVAFLELRRKTNELTYVRTRSGHEVDFFHPSLGLVQVCASLDDPATRAREVDGLRQAMSELGEKRGLILTLREAELPTKVPEGTIDVRPLWRWALSSAALPSA